MSDFGKRDFRNQRTVGPLRRISENNECIHILRSLVIKTRGEKGKDFSIFAG